MSFGSYQQFFEQRRQMLAAGGSGAGAGIGFDIQSPPHYRALGNTPRLTAANFYTAPPDTNVQPPHPSQLPSSFFTGHDPASHPLPGIGKTSYYVLFMHTNSGLRLSVFPYHNSSLVHMMSLTYVWSNLQKNNLVKQILLILLGCRTMIVAYEAVQLTLRCGFFLTALDTREKGEHTYHDKNLSL